MVASFVEEAPVVGAAVDDAPLDGVALVDGSAGAAVFGTDVEDVDDEGLALPGLVAPVAVSELPEGVSAATANAAPAMPIVDTINPDTSLLFSRRIIVRSFG